MNYGIVERLSKESNDIVRQLCGDESEEEKLRSELEFLEKICPQPIPIDRVEYNPRDNDVKMCYHGQEISYPVDVNNMLTCNIEPYVRGGFRNKKLSNWDRMYWY